MDPFLLGTLISAGSSLIGGAMGGDDPVQQQTQIKGFAALPPEVQQAYLKQFLPGVLAQYQNGPNPGPLGRARTGRYDSKGLQELQQYADRAYAQQNSPEAMAQRQAQAAAQAQPDNSFAGDPSVDRNREMALREMYWNSLKGGQHRNSGLQQDGGHNFGDKQYDTYLNNPQYQKFRTGIVGSQPSQQAVPAPLMGNTGNPVMGGHNMPMGGQGMSMGNGNISAGMQGGAQGMGQDLSGMNLGANGVRPIPGIEQFNPMQENAFDQIQQFQPNSIASYANPYSTGALNQLQGLAQFNPNDRSVEDYMKPYQDAVTDRTLQRMERELSGAQNTLFGKASRLGALNSFGGSTLGTMMAQIRDDSANRAQDFIANSNAANFGQARDQRNLEIQRQQGYLNNLVSGGNDTFRLAGGLQAVGNDQRMQTLQQLLGAGDQVQQQGQNEINAANPLIQQQLPQNRLNQLGQHLSMFPESGQAFQYAPGEQNMLTKLGNAGMGFAGLHQGYQNMRGTPWLGAAEKSGIGGMSGGRINSLGGYL